MSDLTTRQALAIGHKLRLLERVRPPVEPGGSLLVPCPHPGCRVMLTVCPEADGWPLTIALGGGHRHTWTLAHRECVEILVSDWQGWYRQLASEPLPF